MFRKHKRCKLSKLFKLFRQAKKFDSFKLKLCHFWLGLSQTLMLSVIENEFICKPENPHSYSIHTSMKIILKYDEKGIIAMPLKQSKKTKGQRMHLIAFANKWLQNNSNAKISFLNFVFSWKK